MIPREILKKIRQIEIRTNRLVTEFAVARGPARRDRFTARVARTIETNSSPNPVRVLKRRERRAPAAPERGCPSRSTFIAVGDSETFHACCAHERAAGEIPALHFNRATCPDRCARLEFRVYAARDEAADRLKAELQTACGARANLSFIIQPSSFSLA
jgi:hypothetical protein